MSILLPHAALRVYDALKDRPGARPRDSDARDAALVAAVQARMSELIGAYRLSVQQERGRLFVFWTELDRLLAEGAFDDLIERL
jgi:hypothetical protein